MKKTLSFAAKAFATIVVAATLSPAVSQAGDTTYYYGKNPVYETPVSAASCYEGGFEFGIFGAGFFPGSDSDHESATGGGISLGYFFDENFGIDFNAAVYSTDSEVQNYTLDAVYRFPIQDFCIAPYVFGGAGFHTNGANSALFRVGAGLDVRMTESMSLFTDAAYNVVSDEIGNYTTIRAGVRFNF